jgi:hypothetical protein
VKADRGIDGGCAAVARDRCTQRDTESGGLDARERDPPDRATPEYAKASAELDVCPAFLPAAEFGELIAKEDADLARVMRLVGIEKPPPR